MVGLKDSLRIPIFDHTDPHQIYICHYCEKKCGTYCERHRETFCFSPTWCKNSADDIIAGFSLPDNLLQALHKLESREREVIQMRFGIGYDDCFTLDEIGKKFQLTRERIRQIEKKALTRLRKSKYAPALRSLMEAC